MWCWLTCTFSTGCWSFAQPKRAASKAFAGQSGMARDIKLFDLAGMQEVVGGCRCLPHWRVQHSATVTDRIEGFAQNCSWQHFTTFLPLRILQFTTWFIILYGRDYFFIFLRNATHSGGAQGSAPRAPGSRQRKTGTVAHWAPKCPCEILWM